MHRHSGREDNVFFKMERFIIVPTAYVYKIFSSIIALNFSYTECADRCLAKMNLRVLQTDRQFGTGSICF